MSTIETIVKFTAASFRQRIAQYVILLLAMLAAVPDASALTAQTITGFAPATPMTYRTGGIFTLSATGGGSGKPVVFASTTTSVCTVASTNVSVLGVGTCTLTANQAGNATYSAAPPVTASVVINKSSQTITFGVLAGKSFGTAPFTISATASSGLAVTFTSTTTPICTVAGTTVTLVRVGTCTIAAKQAGNANYNAATQVTQSFAVTALAAQAITGFAPATPLSYSAGLSFVLSATGGASGNPVTFSSTTSSVCTVAGNTVSVRTAGTCTLKADQAGNASYSAAPQVTKSVVITKSNQAINFAALPNVLISASPITVSATASSGLAVIFTSTTTSVCKVSSVTVTLVGGGTCAIAANQAGNANYNEATQVTHSFAVTALLPQTITDFSLPTPITYSPGLSIGLSAMGGASGNPVTFSTTTSAVCTVADDIVTVVSVGTCTVKADQAGNASYSPAPQITARMVISKASQTINFGALPNVPISSSPVTVSAEASSRLTVTFTSGTTSICKVAGTTVTLLQTGTCTLRANQAGNANFTAAAQVSRSFTVQSPVLMAKIASPLNNATFTAPATISIVVSTTVPPGQSVTQIDYWSNGFHIGSASPGTAYSLTGLAAGTYTIYVRVTDTTGNQISSDPVVVTVVPPLRSVAVSLTSPGNGTMYVAPATISLAATASAISPGTSINRVDFYRGTTLLATATTPPYSYTWTGAPVGRHALTAVATDNLGATGTSAIVYAIVDGSDTCDNTPPPTANDSATRMAVLDKLPITFEENAGQTNADVRFQARGPGYQFYLTERERVMVLQAPWASARRRNRIGEPLASIDTQSAAVRFSFVGANPHPEMTASEPVEQRSNYLMGADPVRWHTDVRHFAQARYHDLYPGIDEVYSGKEGKLEYDLHVSPEANPQAIRLAVNGIDHLSLDQSGDLLLVTARGTLVQKRPVAYQVIAGERREVTAAYQILAANEVSFTLGDYDSAHELVIDPVLVYSTLLGSNYAASVANGIALSRCGEAFVVGGTHALDFPTTAGSFDPVGNPYFADAHMGFVAKLNPSGTGLLYSTYLTGTSSFSASEAVAVAVDATGHAYVAGNTLDADLPTTAGSVYPTAAYGGGFIVKLNNAGNGFVYSSYLGTGIEAIAIDNAGAAYVAARGGVQKVNPTGATLDYTVQVGGLRTSPQAIAVDAAGNAYVAGITTESTFPVTAGAFQTSLPSVSDAGFVSKINPAGSGFVYSTYLGATKSTEIFGLALDTAGNAYVAGRLTTGGTVPNYTGPSLLFNLNIDQAFNQYAFVAELDATGGQLVSFSRIGGSSCNNNECFSASTWANAIALDQLGNAWITGPTASNQIPLVKPLVSQFNSSFSSPDIFVAKLQTIGNSLTFSTLLGGQTEIPPPHVGFATTAGLALAIDTIGSAYIAGVTNRSGFPTTPGALQTTLASGSGFGAFVVKINDSKDTSVALAATPTPGLVGSPVVLTATIAGNAPTGIVTFFEGATALGTATISTTSAPFTASTNLQFTSGSHSLNAVYAGDAHYNGSISPVITLNVIYPPNPNAYPTVTLTGIADGASLVANSGTTYTGARVVVNANAAAGNTINEVRIYVDGSYVYWTLSAPSFSYDYYTLNPLSSGMHTAYASATDNFNHTTTSAPIRFVVNPVGATPPTVSITAPANVNSRPYRAISFAA